MKKENQIKIGDIVEGRINFNTSGSAYLVSPALPKDIYIHRTNSNKTFHLDKVKIEILNGK